MKPTVQIKKIRKTIDTQAPVHSVTLTVTSAEGVTPNIFKLRYTPSRPTSAAYYTFWNVAYLDELTSVPERIADKRKETFIRSKEATYTNPSAEAVDSWVDDVLADIQRLLRTVDASSDVYTEETTIEVTSGEIEQSTNKLTGISETSNVVENSSESGAILNDSTPVAFNNIETITLKIGD